MSNYSELVGILKELLFNRFYPKPQYIRGLLGDGQGNVLVPNRPDYNYVRFSRASTETFEVFNKEVSQPVDGWPVLIGEFPWTPGLVQVVATDWSAYAQTGWGDSVASIQAHAPTHEWPNFAPGSDAINTYLRAITPMRTQAAGSGSTSVMVAAYEYDGGTGTNYAWPGSPYLSLGGATPSTGTMRYMGVYLNPATNTLGVVSGSTTIYTDALEPDRPAWPRGVLPSAYVRLYGGQAAITERDVRDARRLWNNSLIFTGTVGLPTPIVTGSYLSSAAGTPAWSSVNYLTAPDGNPNPAWSVDNAGDLSNPGAGVLDLTGVADALVLDADNDTSISSPTDDQIDFEAGGVDIARITAAGLTLPQTGDDVYIAGDEAGVKQRGVDQFITGIEDHFDSSSFTGWTWASYSGFATPANIEMSVLASHVRIYHNTNTNGFGYKTFTFSTTATINARIVPGFDGYYGVRFDDGSISNYVEFLTQFVSNKITLYYRYAIAGVVTGPTSMVADLTHSYTYIQLQRTATAATWRYTTNTPTVQFITTAAMSWTPTRWGMFLQNNNASPAGSHSLLLDWIQKT